MSERPRLDDAIESHEFSRWYWTMAELQPFARTLGVSAAGPKADLAERIMARLDGCVPPTAAARRPVAAQIDSDLSRSTMIPVGQRSTEALRAFFAESIGPAFRFNGHMRAFLLTGNASLGDAIDHWHATVGTPLPTQSKSLEFNQFTAAWHLANPDGTAAQCRAAWAIHRATPIDER